WYSTGSPDSMPKAASVASMASAAPGTTRGVSRSSMRTSQLPRRARASSQLATAASSEPLCSSPFGEGAKRPRQGGGAALSAVAVVAVAVLLLTAFAALLRLQRQGGHGARLQALHADRLAGLQAIAVGAVLDARQRLVDLADQLALPVARAQLEAELLLLRGTVVRVGEVGRLVLHVRDRPVHLEHQVPLPVQQDGAEVLELLLAHVLLAALDDVRLDVARPGEQVLVVVVGGVVARRALLRLGGNRGLGGAHGADGFLDCGGGAGRRSRPGGCARSLAGGSGLCGRLLRGRG